MRAVHTISSRCLRLLTLLSVLFGNAGSDGVCEGRTLPVDAGPVGQRTCCCRKAVAKSLCCCQSQPERPVQPPPTSQDSREDLRTADWLPQSEVTPVLAPALVVDAAMLRELHAEVAASCPSRLILFCIWQT